MGTCVICGTSVDGKVCDSHQEDVLFRFEGDSADDLVTSRYYEGSVDGYADFGVFVDLVPGVTGLLHRSEVPGRLESLDWEPGDTVYVQVTGVHDNGNIDLGWSIRQSPREFRHELVQGPEGDREVASDQDSGSESPSASTSDGTTGTDTTADDATVESGGAEDGPPREPAAEPEPEPESDPGPDLEDQSRSQSLSGAEPDADPEPEAAETPTDTEEAAEPEPDPDRVAVETLGDRVGDRLAVEGELTDVRQTSGPTVFTLADETGDVECAAFVGAGDRAYPEAEAGDVVRLVGEVERRRGSLQVETESLTVLTGDEAAAVRGRIDDAREARAAPPETELFVPDGPTAGASEAIAETATAIRRAVFEPRPVVIRHAATVDGYVASAAIERAVLPLVEEVHDAADARYHYVDRQPLDDGFYDMSQATRDVVDMLEAAERHDEPHPLFVLVDAGSTAESRDGFEFLDVYDADRVVIDGATTDEVGDAAGVVCTADTTAAALATDVAAHVNPEVRDELGHLPAVSFWDGAPEGYAALAAEHGKEAEEVQELREAVALEAYYHGHGSKRELVTDLFWDGQEGLAAYVSSQFRAKLASELETVEPHLESRDVGGLALSVLDAHAYTHRFDFPPTDLLLDAVHRDRVAEHDGPVATLVVDEDVLHYRTTEPVSARDLAATVSERVPEAGVRARGTTEGHLEFLRGERAAVLEAAVAAVEDRLAAPEQ